MNSFCHYFNAKTCQSCRFLEIDYSEQLQTKKNRLSAGLSSFNNWTMLPTVDSKTQGFRNKAKMLVTGTLERPIIGLAGEKILDEGREILNCPVHHPMINQMLSFMPEFIQLTSLTPYQIAMRKGELKGIILYFSEGSNESYLRLVLRSKEGIDRLKNTCLGLRKNIRP
jgi:23S rRNA (uracil747-C5)-methyltransferase